MNKPTLYLMVGYPGSGKTTASKYIHELTGAVHLWADHERNRRFVNPTHSHKENLTLYEQLNNETAELLHEGKSVIFDTNFNFFKDRERLRAIAASAGAQSVLVWVTTPKELARERATKHSHGQHTRIWGNMPPETFKRIARNMQPPRPEEHPTKLNGHSMTKQGVAEALGL